MRSTRQVALTLLILGGAAACGDSTTSPADLLLTTDSASYTAVSIGSDQVTLKLVMKYRNPTSAPIVLDRCFPSTPYPIYNVELVTPKTGEGAAYAPAWACVGHNNPIVVAAGNTRTDTLVLSGPTGFDSKSGRAIGVLEGTFKIAYGGQHSNEFRVKLPPGGVVPAVPRDLSAAIQTESLLVHMKFSAPLYSVVPAIHVTIYNPRPDTSFIVNCGGLTGLILEKQTGNQWVTAWAPGTPACLSPAIVVPPGGRYETSINVYGLPAGNSGQPMFILTDLPGVYRFVWTNIVDSFVFPGKIGAVIPIELRRSNAFAIVVSP